jgi:hypothetical protein
VDNQHCSPSASAKALRRNYRNSHHFACRKLSNT